MVAAKWGWRDTTGKLWLVQKCCGAGSVAFRDVMDVANWQAKNKDNRRRRRREVVVVVVVAKLLSSSSSRTVKLNFSCMN